MSNSRQPGFEKMYFGGHYWEGNPRFIERAPQTHGHKVTTPVLIMHGEEDTLTFVANSNEMYTMLKFMGKTVEYVKFPREGHGFREPNHRIDYINRSVKWFDKYLK
jgi:dipeptidyl aminopeptidase/acylaminoacyl peptidase